MVRALLLAAASVVGPAVAAPADGVGAARPVDPRGTVQTSSAWGWPLAPDPAVDRRFQAPPTPWSAGHRGVDLAAAVGQPVLSDGRGRVTFSGRVAGRGVVVVTHPGGLRSSFEPVDERSAVGMSVTTGTAIGVVGNEPGHCRPATCLHWGVRRGQTYLDPLLLVGQGPPVLLPLSRQ